MYPTILNQDYIIADKDAYRLKLPIFGQVGESSFPKRGDVVIYRGYTNKNKTGRKINFVKRVVAIGGDRLAVKNGLLYINDKLVESKKIPALENAKPQMKDMCVYELPKELKAQIPKEVQSIPYTKYNEGKEWVLENLSVNGEKNFHWIIVDKENSQKNDYPEAMIPKGHLFLMGDNRSHSYDSRSYGFVDAQDIVGKVERVWFSLASKKDFCGIGFWNKYVRLYRSQREIQ